MPFTSNPALLYPWPLAWSPLIFHFLRPFSPRVLARPPPGDSILKLPFVRQVLTGPTKNIAPAWCVCSHQAG